MPLTFQVEEVVDDVFDESKLDGDKEDTKLMDGVPSKERNGSVASINSESKKASAGDVHVNMKGVGKDGDKISLTKSMEDVSMDPTV